MGQTIRGVSRWFPFVFVSILLNLFRFDSIHLISEHAKQAHHTCHGSKQPAPEESNSYCFNHGSFRWFSYLFLICSFTVDRYRTHCDFGWLMTAIKFPRDTFAVWFWLIVTLSLSLWICHCHSNEYSVTIWWQRESSDFVWPKIVRFKDGKDFFVLSRYKADCITVFVRLMSLPKLSREEKRRLKVAMDTQSQLRLGKAKEEILGKYWVFIHVLTDFMIFTFHSIDSESLSFCLCCGIRWSSDWNRKTKGITIGIKRRKKRRSDMMNCHYDGHVISMELQVWYSFIMLLKILKSVLCFGTVPFKEDVGQVLKIHKSIFTRYWTQENVEASAVLRFQFRAELT